MRKLLLSITLMLAICSIAQAHYLWISTDRQGEVGQEQEVKVHFGEYTYGVIEKVDGEAFAKVENFKLWVHSADGKVEALTVIPQEDHYVATFTPSTMGTYTIVLNNNEIDVIDYSQYDFGIFKTHYHAVAKVQVGEAVGTTAAANPRGITVKDRSVSADTVQLQVLFQSEVLPEAEVVVYVNDLWSKTLTADEQGMVSFALPWNTTYVVEVTKKEEVPGKYKEEPYEFIWHCVTYALTKN